MKKMLNPTPKSILFWRKTVGEKGQTLSLSKTCLHLCALTCKKWS